MTEDGIALVVCGTAMHTPALGAVDILEDVLIVVDDDGTIARIDRPGDPNYDRQKDQARDDGTSDMGVETLSTCGMSAYALHSRLPTSAA